MKIYIYIIVTIALSYGIASAKPGGIDSILKENNVRGSFLGYDNTTNKFNVFYDARCKKEFSPASTFKIANTLIGLETGIIKDSNYTFKWNGEKRESENWNKEMNAAEAIRVSCVPCFQQLAREIGPDRMRFFIDKFNYGTHNFDSTFAKVIDKFWLNGDLKISSYQQIYFLKNLYFNNINAKKKNIDILKSMLLIENNPEYKLYGKTGTIINGKKGFGWFVGWIEACKKVYFFALNIDIKEPDKSLLTEERKKITKEILQHLEVIK